MTIELRRAAPAHRSLLRQLYELYCHDFSPMTRADIGDDGYWTGDDFLDPWPDELHIYLITVDQHWAGLRMDRLWQLCPIRKAPLTS